MKQHEMSRIYRCPGLDAPALCNCDAPDPRVIRIEERTSDMTMWKLLDKITHNPVFNLLSLALHGIIAWLFLKDGYQSDLVTIIGLGTALFALGAFLRLVVIVARWVKGIAAESRANPPWDAR